MQPMVIFAAVCRAILAATAKLMLRFAIPQMKHVVQTVEYVWKVLVTVLVAAAAQVCLTPLQQI